MKWIKLKIYQGDQLLSEVETVESKYDNMINELRCSDDKDTQTKINFLSFREEIEQRIIELDEFYQLNINDSRIGTFEKVRNRLASLLEINIDEGNKIMQKNYYIGNTGAHMSQMNNTNSNSNSHRFKFNQKNQKPRRSKLSMSSSAMRHSSVRKTGTRFGE